MRQGGPDLVPQRDQEVFVQHRERIPGPADHQKGTIYDRSVEHRKSRSIARPVAPSRSGGVSPQHLRMAALHDISDGLVRIVR